MANNPYAPPKAQELEVPAEGVPEQSEHVAWACKLMWVGVVLSTLDTILTAFLGEFGVGDVTALAVDIALAYWFTHYLIAGRNWMRWLVTILTIFGLLMTALVALVMPPALFSARFTSTPLMAVTMGVQLLLSVTEAVLINTPSAREWFRARSTD